MVRDVVIYGAPTAETAPVYQALNQVLDEIAHKYNLFSAITPAPLLGVSNLMGARLTLERPFGLRPEIPAPNLGAVVGWVSILFVVGVGLNALYLWQIGQRVTEHTETPTPGPQHPRRLWAGLLQLTFTLFLIGLLLLIPMSLIMAVLGALSPALSGLFFTFVLSLAVFVMFNLVYAVPGMVQLCQPPLQAIYESIVLTRLDFVGTTGFLLVALIITQGLNFVWSIPDPATWTTLVGIGGHALVSTALIAALFVFYQERLAYLQELRHSYAAQAAQSPVK